MNTKKRPEHMLWIYFMVATNLIQHTWAIYLRVSETNHTEMGFNTTYELNDKLDAIQKLQQEEEQLILQQQQLFKMYEENSINNKNNKDNCNESIHQKSYDVNNNDIVGASFIGNEQQQQQEEEEELQPENNNSKVLDAEGDDEIVSVRQRRDVSDWLIAPNTRWCGRGNTANGTYNRLGGASAADKCCRKHDHCHISIPPLSTRYELFNYRPYTLSYCLCDLRFRTCLKMANDADANTIGKIFFNMVQTQCFVLRTQKICQERDESGNCLRHYVRQRAQLQGNKKF